MSDLRAAEELTPQRRAAPGEAGPPTGQRTSRSEKRGGILNKPSLRSRLTRHVVLPLVLMWALGTAVALSVASYFTGQAFDRSMLDDAYAVAANVRASADGPALNLSPRELGALLFDQSESNYFAVLRPDGELVAGHAGLRPPPLAAEASHGFSEIQFQGRQLRVVSLRRSDPVEFLVVMGQTSASRNSLLHRMLAYTVVPQILLLLLLGWWLLRVIQRDLKPLAELQRAVDRRDARDLTPVPPSATTFASTREVQRLGMAVNSMLARLDESISAQREFAGNVAHELRTPLAGIRAQADYALAHADPQVWREQLTGIIHGEARASHMVEQLLALALADEARAGLRLEPVALNELVRSVLLRYMPKADAAGVDLGGEGLDDAVVVQADASLAGGHSRQPAGQRTSLRQGCTAARHRHRVTGRWRCRAGGDRQRPRHQRAGRRPVAQPLDAGACGTTPWRGHRPRAGDCEPLCGAAGCPLQPGSGRCRAGFEGECEIQAGVLSDIKRG